MSEQTNKQVVKRVVCYHLYFRIREIFRNNLGNTLYTRRARGTIVTTLISLFSRMFVAAVASGTTRIIGSHLYRTTTVGVDTSPAFILLFSALGALQQCARDEIASPVRVTLTRGSGLLRPRAAKRDFSCARATMWASHYAHTKEVRIARVYVRARAHIGTIISHHVSAYIIPATESTPAAVGFARCLPLSRQRSRFNGLDAFNGF